MATYYELAVVIPVFNEEKNIVDLITDWQAAVQAIPVRHRFIIINDGSRDNSLPILQTIAASAPEIEIHTQANAGHGPAILNGYRRALDTEWIFQIDSDHQHDPAVFATLWKNRNDFDFLLGERKEKNATLARKTVSFISTTIVWLLYGNRVNDVNSPYRLMRSASLKEALVLIPAGSFAPNILLTGWFVFFKKRIFTT
ncbi:MAG: glycosyltransferase family 2 protein, partial [Bacteroidota bacterium]